MATTAVTLRDRCQGSDFASLSGNSGHGAIFGAPESVVNDPERPTSGRAHNLVASIEVGSFWREERKSDRQPYPGRRPTIALACASIETRPLASIGTCSRTRDLSCVTSAVAIVVSIGARLGAAIVVDQ